MTFNPLNPNWRWHIISPDSITLKSNIKVARIKEMITNQRRRTNYPSQHLRKCKENAYRCIRRKERQVLLVHNLNSRVTWLWWCLFLIKTSVNVTVNSSSKDSPHRGDHITQDQLFSGFLPKLSISVMFTAYFSSNKISSFQRNTIISSQVMQLPLMAISKVKSPWMLWSQLMRWRYSTSVAKYWLENPPTFHGETTTPPL